MHLQRKTKIIATIGPASESRENLSRLLAEGVDAARLNFSHGVQADHGRRIKLIREIEQKTGKYIGIIADLQGPKMRVGALPKEGVLLRDDTEVILDTTISKYEEGGAIPVPSPIFAKGASKGSRVFLDDGSLLLEVIGTKGLLGRQFVARVLRGGTLFSHKGINVPELKLRTNIFEEKDKSDMAYAIRQKVDYIAVSFIRNGDDMREARRLAGSAPIKLIAKIERPEALANLEDIINESDAIMVARGDLGIETPLWQLPMRQKEIIAGAHKAMKPVIVATQMLESMTKNAIPTRAEVSDVANAVYDSADAVMLSAESASGKYPIEAVRMMHNILEETEKDVGSVFTDEKEEFHDIKVAVPKSAKYIAEQVDANAILVGTATGSAAQAVSHYRPHVYIIASAANERVARSLSIVWGVTAIVIKGIRTIMDLEKKSLTELKARKFIKSGDKVVFVSGTRLGDVGKTNALSVVRVS
ncbi:MAG: pyruvate kinase [Candidatus Ryanbacteria bacterium]|nr:pyruvate kinase [Candidatus Ryanbacteria bacterium]